MLREVCAAVPYVLEQTAQHALHQGPVLTAAELRHSQPLDAQGGRFLCALDSDEIRAGIEQLAVWQLPYNGLSR